MCTSYGLIILVYKAVSEVSKDYVLIFTAGLRLKIKSLRFFKIPEAVLQATQRYILDDLNLQPVPQ